MFSGVLINFEYDIDFYHIVYLSFEYLLVFQVNGNCPGENDNAGSNKKDPQLKETDFGGIDREWSKSIRGKSNKTEIAQNMVYDTRISTIYAHLKMQNINANLSENQAQPRNGQVQDTFGNVKKRHFEKSDSDQVDHNINECCNTLINGEEMECRFWEGQVKLEDIDVNDVEVNGYVSTSTEHKRENDQCRNVSGFFEANKETFHETFVKEEEYDDYDDNGGDAGGIIGGFLEDKIDDLDDDEHYDGELVTGYTSDHKPQVRQYLSTKSYDTKLHDIIASFGIVLSRNFYALIILLLIVTLAMCD